MAQIDSGEWPRANERALRPDQRWEWRGGAKSRERPEVSGHTMKHISGTLQDCAATRGRRFTVETGLTAPSMTLLICEDTILSLLWLSLQGSCRVCAHF